MPKARGPRSHATCCRCLDIIVQILDDWWFNVKACTRRRRNSYKLFVFYVTQAVMSSVLFVIGVIFFEVGNGDLTSISAECVISSLVAPITDGMLREEVSRLRGAVVCDGDVDPGACTLSSLKSVLDFILAVGVINAIQMFFSAILAVTFRLFANIRAEDLQHQKTTWKTTIAGGICKQFPWLARFLHLAQFISILGMVVVVVQGTCFYQLSKTMNCEAYSPDCEYNKVRNCQYYFYYCWPTMAAAADPLVAAMVPDFVSGCYTVGAKEKSVTDPTTNTAVTITASRDKFSGLVDIRNLPVSRCLRCKMLEDDSKSSDTSRFSLLNVTVEAKDSSATSGNSTAATPAGLGEGEACTDSGACFRTALSADSIAECDSTRLLRRLEGTSAEVGAPRRQEENSATGATTAPPSSQMVAPATTAAQTNTTAPVDSCVQEDFTFSKAHCDNQNSSFVFRFGSIYLILVGACMVVLTFTGQTLRMVAKPEAFFFQPPLPDEFIGLKILRRVAP
eukprot:TRINITY_DN15177_c0_g1_i1.p1 TRINITY_DN15177_c0_g1~~TRINITY_DN15177_c0_g1_i1.p1  ORF type:complete len:507 (+),score=75.58 TRINITY_DN15177_c0_g1_i1:125-1645(+)